MIVEVGQFAQNHKIYWWTSVSWLHCPVSLNKKVFCVKIDATINIRFCQTNTRAPFKPFGKKPFIISCFSYFYHWKKCWFNLGNANWDHLELKQRKTKRGFFFRRVK